MPRFESGPLQLEADWLTAYTRWRGEPVNGAFPDRTRTGRQIALGAARHV